MWGFGRPWLYAVLGFLFGRLVGLVSRPSSSSGGDFAGAWGFGFLFLGALLESVNGFKGASRLHKLGKPAALAGSRFRAYGYGAMVAPAVLVIAFLFSLKW
jgi:hypothetical protein